MNMEVSGYSAYNIDGYLNLDLQGLSRDYVLHKSHEDFCLYLVLIADATHFNHAISFEYISRGACYINNIRYYLKESIDYKKKIPITKKDLESKKITTKKYNVSNFSCGGRNLFVIQFDKIDSKYFFKPMYPHFLNWVYLIGCSFKEESLLEITYIEDTFEIIDVTDPLMAQA